MKKFLLALFMTLMVSATCFAEGAASRFNTEEKAADALVAALIGNGTYEQVSKSLSSAVKEKLNAEDFENYKKEIQTKVGKIKSASFVRFNKPFDLTKNTYNGIDQLVYVGTISKERFAEMVITFALENNSPKVFGINVVEVPVEQPKQEAAPAKK